MIEQDPPRRLRRCTSPPRHACAFGFFAALSSACTPLTGVQKAEQSQALADAGVAASDAGARTQTGESDHDAGQTARGGSGGSGGAAKSKGSAGAGQAGKASVKQDMPAAGSSSEPAAGSGGATAPELLDVTCVPVFVQEAPGQFVQVRCREPIMLGSDRVEYLALPSTTLPASCTRFSELASAALLRAAPIGLRVNAAGRGNDSGCETTRCRTIRAFSQGM